MWSAIDWPLLFTVILLVSYLFSSWRGFKSLGFACEVGKMRCILLSDLYNDRTY